MPSLKRALLVNTRPTERTLPNVAADVYTMPLLALQAYDEPMNAIYQQRLQQGAYHLLVVVSITAAQYALSNLDKTITQQLAKDSHAGRLTVVAVGDATAQVLRQAGFDVVVPQNSSNEGMLALPQIQALTATQSVLFWKGVGGRTLLLDMLAAKDVAIDCCLWYQRIAPQTLPRQASYLKQLSEQYQRSWMLITSQAAWQHWCTVANWLDIDLQSFHYIALGDRLSKLIAPARVTKVASLDELVYISW